MTLHFWTFTKSVIKIRMFSQMKKFLLASSSSWSLLYWQTAAVSRKIGF